MTKIGDIVTGRGKNYGGTVHIVVDKICSVGSFVAGRMIVKGRLTKKRDVINVKPVYDVFTGNLSEGGWRKSDEKITYRKSFSATIMDMEVGDQIEVDKQQHKVTTCRNIAARIAIDEGRVYSVNRTENGCTITRKE